MEIVDTWWVRRQQPSQDGAFRIADDITVEVYPFEFAVREGEDLPRITVEVYPYEYAVREGEDLSPPRTLFGADEIREFSWPDQATVLLSMEESNAGEVVEDTDDTPEQVADQTSEAPAGPEGEPEYYWPNIQKYIETKEGAPPAASCGICMQPIYHPGICPSRSRHRLEAMEVLQCGHIIGRTCWQKVLSSSVLDGNGQVPKCPFCRDPQPAWVMQRVTESVYGWSYL